MIFELLKDFADALDAMPPGHRRRKTLALLDEAIRRDVPLLEKRPTTLFQCLWNSAWWYDSPEAAKHYPEPEGGWPPPGPPWTNTEFKISTLLEDWRRKLEERQIQRRWFRSLRPPKAPLDSPQGAVFGGNGTINCVAFAAGGTELVAGGNDIRRWDVKTGICLRVIDGYARAKCMGASSDGTRIGIGFYDGSIEIFPMVDECVIAEAKVHEAAIEQVVVSSDGSRVATRSTDDSILVCDGTHAAALARLDLPSNLHTVPKSSEDYVTDMAFSPDGERIVCATTHSCLLVFDTATGKQVASIPSEDRVVFGVTYSEDGRRIVGLGNSVCIWDASDFASKGKFSIPRTAQSAACSTDASVIAAAYNDSLYLWSRRYGEDPRELSGHSGLITCIAFSPDGDRLATGGTDQTVRLWNPRGRPALPNLVRHVAQAGNPVYSADGSMIATGCGDNDIRLWDARNGTASAVLPGHQIAVSSLQFTPDGSRLVSGSYDTTVRIWDTTTHNEIARMYGHKGVVHAVAVSNDGTCIASADCDELRIWSLEDASLIQVIDGAELGFKGPLVFSADGSRLCSAAGKEKGRTWHVWDLQSGMSNDTIGALEDLSSFTGHPQCAELRISPSPGGARVSDKATHADIGYLPWLFPNFILAPDNGHMAGTMGSELVIMELVNHLDGSAT